MTNSRRFPPPWFADRIDDWYVVRAATGPALAYVSARDDNTIARQAGVLTMDEARRMVANIAKLPDLLRGSED